LQRSSDHPAGFREGEDETGMKKRQEARWEEKGREEVRTRGGGGRKTVSSNKKWYL